MDSKKSGINSIDEYIATFPKIYKKYSHMRERIIMKFSQIINRKRRDHGQQEKRY